MIIIGLGPVRAGTPIRVAGHSAAVHPQPCPFGGNVQRQARYTAPPPSAAVGAGVRETDCMALWKTAVFSVAEEMIAKYPCCDVADKQYEPARKWNTLTGRYIARFDKVYEYTPNDIYQSFAKLHPRHPITKKRKRLVALETALFCK